MNNLKFVFFFVAFIVLLSSHPALPPASMWLANVTSFDHTSNCHFLSPSTPQCTRPLWMPTRMLTLTPVTSRTNLQRHHHQFPPFSKQAINRPAERTTSKKHQCDSRYGLNHVDAHLNTAVGVVRSRLRQSRHAVVTIAQNFYSETVVLLKTKTQNTWSCCCFLKEKYFGNFLSRSPYRCQLVKTGKEFIERHDKLLSCALWCQTGETLNVCKQNTGQVENREKNN